MKKIINLLIPGDTVLVEYTDSITNKIKFKIKEAKLLKDESIIYSNINSGEFYNANISENYFIIFRKDSSPILLISTINKESRLKTTPVGYLIDSIKLIEESKLRKFIERKEKCDTSCPVRVGMIECEKEKCEFFNKISGALIGDDIVIKTIGGNKKEYEYTFPLIAIDLIDKNKHRFYFSQNLNRDLEKISNRPNYPISDIGCSFRYYNNIKIDKCNSLLISPKTLNQCDYCLFKKGSSECYGCSIKDFELEKLLKYIKLC